MLYDLFKFLKKTKIQFFKAIHNRPIIIGILILAGVDVNCRSFTRFGKLINKNDVDNYI